MALVKAFPTSFGVDAEFWVMESIPTINKRGFIFSVVLNGYLNRDAYLAGASHLMSKHISWEGEENFPIPNGVTLNNVQIYQAIAGREDFAGRDIYSNELIEAELSHSSGAEVLTSSTVIEIGEKYKAQVTISSRKAGSITISFGGKSKEITVSDELIDTATSVDAFTVIPTQDFDGSIDISLKKVVGIDPPCVADSQDWV
jgi:hypothetical protein